MGTFPASGVGPLGYPTAFGRLVDRVRKRRAILVLALAGHSLQAIPVQNRDPTEIIADKPGVPQSAHCRSDPRAPGSEYRR